MGAIERITVAMPADMAASLRRHVESGAYDSTSQIVQEALRDWQRLQDAETRELEELRALVQQGIDSGPSIPADQAFAQVRADIGAMMAER